MAIKTIEYTNYQSGRAEQIAVTIGRGSVTLESMPVGYPSADARAWAEVQEQYRAIARAVAAEQGRRSVEVYDSDCQIDVVEA
jgi:hypothetical protein